MRSQYRRYDPRLKNLVAKSRKIDSFALLGIPKSNLRQWVKNEEQDYFTLPELELDTSALVQEVLSLKARLSAAEAKENLVVTTIRIFGFQIQYRRLPSAEAKTEIIAAIKNAAQILPLAACLTAIGLSAARFHHWLKRQVDCLLADQAISNAQLRDSVCSRGSRTKIVNQAKPGKIGKCVLLLHLWNCDEATRTAAQSSRSRCRCGRGRTTESCWYHEV